ncbi:MAG: glycosyltransferase family 39 protein [Oscillospiraceae bacterium]|nr:glycosyltransferase family 39 protein [Oscillospiraceae bacterium]
MHKQNSLKRIYELCGINTLKVIYSKGYIIAMVLATALVLFAKIRVAMYPTQDSVGYVLDWMKQIKEVGIAKFYSIDADYSPLYLFMISLFTLVPTGTTMTVGAYTFFPEWMLTLKTCYFIFDILNALAVYLIIKSVTNDKTKAAIGYLIMVILPVQFINSAVWGNADSIYVCFLLYCIYFALKNKGGFSMFFFGLALANKLQALFIAPFLVYLLLNRKIKLYKTVYAPLAVIASFIPAYVCGAGFFEPFAFYSRQLNGYSKLTLGCPNFWHLFSFSSKSENIINRGAPYFALAVIGVFFAIILMRNIKQTDSNLLAVAAFTVGITVFFLPHLHERYFYMLDVLAVVYALSRKKNHIIILLMQLASGIAYYHYISGRYFINLWGEDSVHIAAFIIVAVLTILFIDIMKSEHTDTQTVLAAIYDKENRLK